VFDRWVKIEQILIALTGLFFLGGALFLYSVDRGRYLPLTVFQLFMGGWLLRFSRQEARVHSYLSGIHPKRHIALGVVIIIVGVLRLLYLNKVNGVADPSQLLIGILLIFLGLSNVWRGMMASVLSMRA